MDMKKIKGRFYWIKPKNRRWTIARWNGWAYYEEGKDVIYDPDIYTIKKEFLIPYRPPPDIEYQC
jgi:hypothetical protein